MNYPDLARCRLSEIRPPVRFEVRVEFERLLLDSSFQFRTDAKVDEFVRLTAEKSTLLDANVASDWTAGSPIPEGWVECLPGPHIRRLDIDDPLIRHDGCVTGWRPFIESDEMLIDSFGDPRPVVVTGPSHERRHR
jgi:hypothetical protein